MPDTPEKTVGEVIQIKIDIYKHYLRRINKKPNYGWLRNIYYSISQQFIR